MINLTKEEIEFPLNIKNRIDKSNASLCLDATIENLSKVSSFIEEKLEQYNLDLKLLMQIQVAVEEIYVNIAHYAYKENIGFALILLCIIDNVINLSFIDSGLEFNPLDKEDPNTKLAAENRKIGGLGIFMVKKTMDDVSYERIDGFNILNIKKRVN